MSRDQSTDNRTPASTVLQWSLPDTERTTPMPASTHTDGLLTREAAADLAGVGIRTIDLWVRLGKLEALKRAGGKYKVFVREDDVRRLITPGAAEQPVGSDPFAGLDL